MTSRSAWAAPEFDPAATTSSQSIDLPGTDRNNLDRVLERVAPPPVRHRPARHRIVVAAVIATVVALSSVGPPLVNARRGSGGSGPTPTPTPSPTTFSRVFSAQDNGAIRMFGNSNMTCDAGATNCTTARDASPGLSLSSYNNNAYTMRWIDNDADGTTFNSTSADLEIPDGSTILRAQLVWGGNDASTTVGDRSAVRLAVGNGAYQTISAESYAGQQASPIWTSSGFYQASADVTSIVQANPSGSYWVADIASIPNVSNKFAGWALIVAYRNPGEPVRDLTINLGLDQISGTDNTQIVVDGFLTPLTGTVNASVGLVAWEGDLGIIGDTAALDGTQLSNVNHPSTNFFDSSVSDPTVTAARNPDYANGMGVDVARVDASNIIANGATSATLLLSTTGDAYAPGVVTTQVDLFAPAFAAVTKSVVNLSGHDPAWPGDTLEYQISLANTGGDSAEQMVLTDTIPAGTTYVAGSIVYLPSTATATETAMSDGSGDDAAEHDAINGEIIARVGTGADATAGGTLAPLESAAVRFRVTVDEGPTVGTPVTNAATVDYLSPTIAKAFTYRTNAVTTETAAVADIKVVKSVIGNSTADNPVRYQLTVTNNGPSVATGVVLSDTMPTPTFSPIGSPISGMSVVDDPPLVVGSTGTCSRTPFVNGSTTYYPSFGCSIDSLAVGESSTVTFDATVYGTAIPEITNTATVSAEQVDPVAANNTDTRTSPRSEVTDLWLRGGPNPGQWNGLVTAGKPFPYLMEVVTLDYQGYATAGDVVVTMELPLGFSYVDGSSTGPSCTQTGQLLECPFGANPPGSAPGPNWTVVLLPDPSLTPGNYPYSVQATTSTPEISLSNNTNAGNFSLDGAGGYPSYQNDLAVTETLDGSIAAGGVAAYTITLTNNGPSTAYTPTLTQPTPAGYTIESISSDHGSCADTAGDLVCSFDPLVPADNVTIHVVYRVDPGLGADDGSTTIDVTATADEGSDYAQADTDPTNDSATATGSIDRNADLALVKTQDTYGFTWGDTIGFTFTATNAGPSTARTVTLTDSLPVDMTAVTPMPAGCSVITPATPTSGDVFECAISDIPVGGSTSVTITVATSSAGAGSATNSAAITSSTPDPDAANNTPATTVSTADQAADLSITKSVSDSTPTPGVPFAYTLSVTNHGPSDAHADWSVTDTLPAGVNFVSGTDCAGGVADQVTCATGSVLTAGATATFTLTVDADTGRTGRIVNSATVDPGLTDPNYDDNSRNNNTASVGADLSPLADLTVSAPSAPASFPAGTSVPVEFTVSNLGPSDAASPVLIFTVPAGAIVTADATYPAGYGCTQLGQQVRCSLPSTSPGTPQTVPLVVTVDSARAPGSVAIEARVGTETPESDLTNNTAATLTLTVTNDAALSIAKAGPAAFTAGAIESYFITVANTGNSDTPDGRYVVTDTVPDGLTVLSAAMPGATCAVAGQVVTCTRGGVPGGTEITLTIGVLVGIDIDPAGVANTAQLTNDAGVGESPLNSNTVTTPVTASSALWVSKTADRDTIAAGGSIVYSMVVGNDGPSTAPAVVMTDDLPGGLTVLGTGVTTDTGSCNGTDGATSVVCDLGDLPVGGRANITILARVPNSLTAGVTLTNNVTVTDGRDDSSAIDAVSTPTVQEADLSVVKYPLSDIPVAGLEHQYVISAINNGPSAAAGVVITDQLPAGATFAGAEPPEANCANSGGVVTCALGDLTKGQVLALLVTVTVDQAAGGSELTNSASISSDTDDPNGGNNSSTVTQTVEALSTLSMTKQITAGLVEGAVVAGTDVTYTITATNVGPSDASGAWILDRVPTDTDGNALGTFVSASIDGDVATCEYVEVVDDAPTPTVTDRYHQCTYGTLPVGATMTMTFTINVKPDAAGDITNWAWGGAANNTEASPAPPPGIENTPYASTTAPIVGQADVGVQVALPPATPGEPLDAVVTVTNAGPQTADSVTIDIALPSDASFDSATGASCIAAAGGAACTIGTLESDTQRVIVLTLTTDPAATGTSDVNATATTTSIDPDLTNNEDAAVLTWTPTSGLTILKSAPATAVPGATMTYQVIVDNFGPSVATAVRVSDLVATGAVPTAATIDDGGTCAIDGQLVTCSLDTLAVDSSVTVTIDVDIDPTATGELVNVAEASAATATQPVPSTPTRTTLVPATALSVLKTAPAFAVPGRAMRTELTVTNAGPSAATGVVVEDVFPAAAVPIAAAMVGGGSCMISRQQVRCMIDALDVDGSATVTIDAYIDPAATGELVNVAQASAATSPNPVQSQIARTGLLPASALSITKAAPSSAAAGTPLVYEVTVTNGGPSTATEVAVSDVVPEGAVPNEASITGGGNCTITGQEVRCTRAALARNESATVSIVTAIDPDATGELVNVADASAATAEPVSSDPTVTALVTQTPLSIVKSAPASAVPGQAITYEITVGNAGPSTATDVVVSDQLPTGATPINATMTSPGTCAIDTQLVTCSLSALDPKATATLTIVAMVGSDTTDELINSAEVSAATTAEVITSNPTRTVLVPSAVLSITKTAPETAVPGSALTFEIEVSNSGPSDATDVVITDRLPLGATPVDNAVTGGGTCASEGQLVTCRLATLAVGASATMTVDALIDVDATGEVVNAATVVAVGSEPVTSQTARTSLLPAATLEVSKAAPQNATPGTTIEYTVTVTNAGPSTATEVTLHDRLPEGATPSAAAISGDGTCRIVGQDVDCGLASLTAGTSTAVTIEATIDPAATGELRNVAVAASAVSESVSSDPALTSLVPQATLSVRKTAPDVAVPGRTIAYEIVLTNTGPSTATGIVIADRLPNGATPISTSHPDVCTIDGQVVSCGLESLGPGSTATVTVDAMVSPDATGELVNAAEAAASTAPDPVSSNTVTTRLVPETALSVVKSASTVAVPGQSITYEIAVTNAGPSTAFGVAVTDQLPLGIGPDVAAAGNGGNCTVDRQVVTCHLTKLSGGTTATVTIDATINPDATGDLVNVARAVAENSEPVESNTVTTRLQPSTELTLDVAASHDAMLAGETIIYTIRVGNSGPSIAENVVAVDRLPTGLSTDADSVSATKGTCGVAGQVVTCTIGHLMPDETHKITIKAESATDMAHGTMLNNEVSLSSSSSQVTLIDDVDVEMMTPASTTSATTVTTIELTTPTSASDNSRSTGSTSPGTELPRTGTNLGGLIVVASTLVAVGVWLRRRRRRSIPR